MPSDAAPAQRLHPLSLLFMLGSAIRGILLPIVAVVVFSGGSSYFFWLLVFFVFSAISAVFRYATYTYRLGDDGIRVREGVLTRNERHIPYARIQNVNLVQNVFHRLFGVAEVHLETASGSKPEAIIRVLSLASVETMRRQVARERGRDGDETETPADETTLLSLDLRELLTLGLLSNRGMVVIGALLGLIWQFDFWEPDWERLAKEAPEWANRAGVPQQAPPLVTSLLLGAAAVIVALLGLKLLSMIWAVFRFYGFTLTRGARELRARYGLLTRYTATIPRHRIQLLSSRSSPLQRRFGRVAVLAETAGGGASPGDGEEQSRTHRLWLAPILPAARIEAFWREIMPDVDLGAVEWRRLPRRAAGRVAKRGLILVGLVSIGAVVWLQWWGLAIAAAGSAGAVLYGRLWWKHAAWAELPTAVAFRSGWWTRRASVVRFAKIQSVGLFQTPFDRGHRMARLAVDTAGAGRAGHRVHIPFLPEETAKTLRDRLAEEAARRSFRW